MQILVKRKTRVQPCPRKWILMTMGSAQEQSVQLYACKIINQSKAYPKMISRDIYLYIIFTPLHVRRIIYESIVTALRFSVHKTLDETAGRSDR